MTEAETAAPKQQSAKTARAVELAAVAAAAEVAAIEAAKAAAEAAAEAEAADDKAAADIAALAEITDPKLRKALSGLRDTLHDKAETRPAAKPVQMRLPLFSAAHSVPNELLRAALFPARNFKEGERKFVKNELIYSVGDLRITFTGQQFDQSDMDVLLAIFDIGSPFDLGERFTFTSYGLLKALRRDTGGSDHAWLRDVITRLRGGTIAVREGKKRILDGLLSSAAEDESTGAWVVRLNPKWCDYFGFGQWSQVHREQRAALGRNGTAKVLHGYYSSHAAPGPHRYETLAGIAGLKNKQRADMRRKVIKAHDALAAPACGFLVGFEAGPDTIKVQKATHTHSQKRHLAAAPRKRGRPRKSLTEK